MTKIEHDACRGWSHFRSRMKEIWKNYARYGEVVLEKDLEKGDEKFKPLFSQAKGDVTEFEKLIRRFWEDNYHFVAGNFTELVNILKKFRKNKKDYLLLLPEISSSYCKGDTNGCNEIYSVTRDFYNQVIVLLKGKRNIQLINYPEKEVFTIMFSESDVPRSYKELKIFQNTDIIFL